MSSAGPQIQTGYWIDHSRGVVLGGTLTYSQNAGSQLISAATVMVSLIGASVWAITAFFLHQNGATKGLQDEYDAQKQVILRNGASPVGTVVAYYNLGSTWHKHTRDAWKRSIVHILPPLLIFIAFTVASIFVGQIAESPYNSNVLLQPKQCGMLDVSNITPSLAIKYQQLYSNISQIADTYARACYQRTSSDSVSCGAYATPRISYAKSLNGSCPIGAGNCETPDNGAVNLRAHNIDSHNDFGINAPASQRLRLNYNATCAPVSHNLLSSFIVRSDRDGIRDNDGNISTLELHIGKDVGNGFDVPYNYSNAIRNYGGGVIGYSVRTLTSFYPHKGIGGWLPLSPFNQSQADLNIFIIAANGLAYAAPNRDPIFATFNQSAANAGRLWYPLFSFQTMICGETYQICKDAGAACTGWTSVGNLFDEVDKLQLDPKRNATWARIAEAIYNANMGLAAATPSPLRAADYVLGKAATSAGLPDDQWTHEAEGWFQATLARMQYITQSYAALPSFFLDQATAINLTIAPPDTPEIGAQCTAQRIQTPAGYTSYNVFALVFIFVIAVITISLAIFIVEYSHKLPGRHPGGSNHHKLIAYQADGMLQLHRMALEGAGLGGWKSGRGARKSVPFTDTGMARVPPPIVETRAKGGSNTQHLDTNGDDEWEDGLLYYERVDKAEDESDGPTIRPI